MSNLVLSSSDIRKGKRGKNRVTAFTQPLQFLSLEDKDDEWKFQNMDWGEYQGMRQIWHKAPHFSKNFNLANGIIDRSDYVGGTTPNNEELLANLMSSEEETHLDLRFYPFIPSFVNTLCTEYSKRNTKYIFGASDEYSYNEMLQMKEQMLGDVLLKEAEQKMLQKLMAGGMDVSSPENQEQIQQQISPENLKTLPEIQSYFKKNYRSMVEEWASHQMVEDVKRFHMEELEERNFRNSLITDSAYFHYVMGEDDYDIEMWNPSFTFAFKAPETRYTSQGQAVGNIKLMTIPEVIDKHGYIMSSDQLESLEMIFPATNALYPVTGYDATSYYDNNKSHAWNVDGDSLGMRQVTSMIDGTPNGGGDMVSKLLQQSDHFRTGENYLVRVTTYYWKSQRKVGHLTAVKDSGEVVVKVVDESYEVTSHPVYNNTLIENRNPDTLVFGEHIDWIWINQTWGGIKIGPNVPSYYGMPQNSSSTGLQPIYIGIGQNKIGPLKYQFKGDKTLYGCKLPVEGATFSDYNSRSTCPVDLLKPFQIGYNVVNNQIADILMDELGTIIVLNQNELPQQSLGEDWGKGNYAKAYVAMKNFNILPLDRSLANQEGVNASTPVQTLDASQTQRLLGKIQLAQYFKNEGLSLMGITPQRLGQPVGRQTATGVEENLNAAYAQTEKYFTQYADDLMPRVHQMRTDLAQYYQSTKPSFRLQHMTSKEERVNFQMNGTDLLLRDINVQCVSTTKNRNVIEELRKLLITNNTAGGTIYELGHLLTAESLGEMNTILKGIETKAEKQRQEEYSQQQQLQTQAEEAAARDKQLAADWEAQQLELNRQRDVTVAEIRAAGYSGSVDLNENQQNDYLDNLEVIRNQQEFQDTMNLEREKNRSKSDLAREKSNLDREKMNTQLRAKQIDLEIARENKTQFDLKKHHEKKQKEKEKKKSKK